MSQSEMVLNVLKYRPLTSKQASALYGIDRLAARIYDLKTQGHDIITMPKTVTNRYGAQVKYAEYYLLSIRETNEII